MTLLDQAKRQKLKNRATQQNPKELLDVALAVLNNEIRVSEVTRAMYPRAKVASGFHQLVTAKLWGSIRDAVGEGRIRIEKQKEGDE